MFAAKKNKSSSTTVGKTENMHRLRGACTLDLSYAPFRVPVWRNNLSPYIMWSPFRYSVFRLIRPDQTERVERSILVQTYPHEPYEMIRLEI